MTSITAGIELVRGDIIVMRSGTRDKDIPYFVVYQGHDHDSIFVTHFEMKDPGTCGRLVKHTISSNAYYTMTGVELTTGNKTKEKLISDKIKKFKSRNDR